MSYILRVQEEDGSSTYYSVLSQHESKLNQINNKIYTFYCNGIYSDGKCALDDISDFVSKFRHGKYNQKWYDIASKLYTTEYNDCHSYPYDFSVFLNH